MNLLPLLVGLWLTLPAVAQNLPTSTTANHVSDEIAVKATITQLFAGMRQADSVMAKNAFLPTARLQTVMKNKQGETIVREDPLPGFFHQIGIQKPQQLDERLTSMDVRIDGDLATVWAPYTFFYKGQQSHCGTNAFTLVRVASGWKIQTIIDTRRREGCK